MNARDNLFSSVQLKQRLVLSDFDQGKLWL